ncbi:hypothetical protein SADUNF_Sadunf05G0050000 [Salix dunnii]|uniref:Uncharacterized protein n=1 Tax=Salix dunnii TaxID=1413687 RepID=A0A835MYP4_9ROSI|nr:hypothetical protein SADUNF_Sadunf05G0050000 [Salix dunnii]
MAETQFNSKVKIVRSDNDKFPFQNFPHSAAHTPHNPFPPNSIHPVSEPINPALLFDDRASQPTDPPDPPVTTSDRPPHPAQDSSPNPPARELNSNQPTTIPSSPSVIPANTPQPRRSTRPTKTPSFLQEFHVEAALPVRPVPSSSTSNVQPSEEDRIYEELDETKARIEKLKADLKHEAEFSDNFKCSRRLIFRKWEILLLREKKCKISSRVSSRCTKSCSANHISKVAGWSSRQEKLTTELDNSGLQWRTKKQELKNLTWN